MQEETNGVIRRYVYPVLTRQHIPLEWRYDFNPATNPCCMERIGFNATMNSGALKWNGKYLMVVRVEGADRKSFFAIAESPNGWTISTFGNVRWYCPMWIRRKPMCMICVLPLTRMDGFMVSFAANAMMTRHRREICRRTRNLVDWERLPDLKAASQQRNVVLHPEFVNGKYALYTRPQDDFINAGNGGGIGWALIDDITRAEVKDEMIINHRYYHTIKEVKNGEGPHPIRTSQGWLHLAHGVRGCAAGLRYVLYLYMTAADEPWRVIAEPAGYLLAPLAGERVGDVSNVLFSNGWIADDDGTVYIYYASSDTRMHVAVSTVDRLVDYCLHTPADGLRSAASVAAVNALIDRNEAFLNG